jgi:tetratricopeptide (TPR) repeat protein
MDASPKGLMKKKNALPRWLSVFILIASLAMPAQAEVFSQESFKTHLRWNLVLPKEQVVIQKKSNQVILETMDFQLFQKMSTEMLKMKRADGYVEKVTFDQGEYPTKPARAIIDLKNESVELFSFYRDVDKKWILDFWVNADLLPSKAASLQKPLPLPQEPAVAPVVVKKKTVFNPQKSILSIVKVPEKKLNAVNPELRDFRYGSAFIWDYEPLLPGLERDINLESKIPDSLYPIRDRELLDDPKEAHVQLTINLYRQEKWGLMNKSLTLYQKKYGKDSNSDLLEWIRVNSLLKTNLTKKDKTLQASAMNILSNLVDISKDYEIKRASYRYLIQYRVDRNDFFKALELGKEFFVEARGQFDHDMVVLSSNIILNALARLRQDDKISEFLSDKKLASLLPAQIDLAYNSYALLKNGKPEEVIRRFRAVEKGLAKPVHPAILFNVSEALFRQAQYEDSIKLFDQFLVDWSHLLEAPAARLRLALSYELLNKPYKQTVSLYKNAIDRSPNPSIRYEAKLRYVGMRLVRKIILTTEDLETEVFLEQSEDEKSALKGDHKRLLWLVRLRSFIAKKDYSKALNYLATIPLDTLKPTERRVFEGDGAEIIFGLVQDHYLQENYTQAVKTWEVYKTKYESQVAGNPYMNFVVADSFMRLGLHESFERSYKMLKELSDQPMREFPVWVERTKDLPINDMIEELGLMKSIAAKEWDQARAILASYPVSLRDSANTSFYKGLMAYHTEKWSEAAEEFEKVMVKQDPKNRLTPRQMADLLMGYVESLYNLKDGERFRSVVRALILDIQQSKSAPILNVSERVNYLFIENLVAEDKQNWNEIEKLTVKFKEQFIKSPYTGRIEYLLGLSFLRNGKLDEGKVVLEQLLEKKEIPLYVREMARTELSALTLQQKRL